MGYKLTILAIGAGVAVQAQDTLKTTYLNEVVITGTKSEIPVEKSGKTIYKLSSEDLRAASGKSVADVLNAVPGVQMDGNFGPLGTNIGYFVRGASSKRTLILIDGVPFNDPSGIDPTYDLRLVSVDQVESIEILKGGLSTLYGTGAAAGVINITLKKPEKKSMDIGMEYGSFNTLKPSMAYQGNSGNLKYMVNASYLKSEGFSAAKDENNEGFDKDGFQGINVLGRLNYQFSESFDLGFTTAIDDYKNDFDAAEFTDGDHTSKSQQWRVGLSPKWKWSRGNIRVDAFYWKQNRYYNSPDFFVPDQRSIDKYFSDSWQLDAVMEQNLSNELRLIGGVNYQNQAYGQPAVDRENFSIYAPYATLIFDNKNWVVQAGGRLNIHNEYGSKLVYNFNPAYLVDLSNDTRLKIFSSYATSFITPSLFQLYSIYGNTDLQPEESQTWEFGAGVVRAKFILNAAIFYRKDENLIDFRSLFDDDFNWIGGEYFNTDNYIETKGLELDVAYRFTSLLTISGHYTLLEPANEYTLYRVPHDKWGLAADVRVTKEFILKASYLYTSVRRQQYFNSETNNTDVVALERFGLLDLSGSYQLNNLRIFGAVNNLLGEQYDAIYGFTTRGRTYDIGVNYQVF
jgi:vitamin B12 transporter